MVLQHIQSTAEVPLSKALIPVRVHARCCPPSSDYIVFLVCSCIRIKCKNGDFSLWRWVIYAYNSISMFTKTKVLAIAHPHLSTHQQTNSLTLKTSGLHSTVNQHVHIQNEIHDFQGGCLLLMLLKRNPSNPLEIIVPFTPV